MASNKDRLEFVEEWITEARQQGATRLELQRKLDGTLIRPWRFGANDQGDLSANEIATQIVKRAEREGAGENSIRVTFVLLAYTNEGASYVDRTLLVVDGGNAKGNAQGEEYEPTVTGMLTQLMRTNLDQTRLILSSQDSRHQHAEQLIDRLQKENVTLQGERLKVWDLLEKVQTMHLEREQLRQAMTLEGKRDEYLFEKLSMIVPVFMNRLMGGGPGKGTPFFGEEMVRQLVGNLTPQQTEAMLKNEPLHLSDTQLGLIAELSLAYAEKEKTRRKLNGGAEAPPAEDGKAEPS